MKLLLKRVIAIKKVEIADVFNAFFSLFYVGEYKEKLRIEL